MTKHYLSTVPFEAAAPAPVTAAAQRVASPDFLSTLVALD